MRSRRLYYLIVLLIMLMIFALQLSLTHRISPVPFNSTCTPPAVALVSSKKYYTKNEKVNIVLNVINRTHEIINIEDQYFLYSSELSLKFNPPVIIPNCRDMYIVNVASDPIMLQHNKIYTGIIDNPFLNTYFKSLNHGYYHIPYTITVACKKEMSIFDKSTQIMKSVFMLSSGRLNNWLVDFYHCDNTIDYPLRADGELSFVILPEE